MSADEISVVPTIGLAVLALCFLQGVDAQTFQTTTSLVKADVYVYDHESKAAISDLQASDFTIFDEDQRREIAYFGGESGPVDLLFLLDVSGSIREQLPKFAASAEEALAVLQPGDRAAVMAFSKTTALTQTFSADWEAVARGIRAVSSLQIGLDTDINQALWAAADYLHAESSRSRRAIFVLTDNVQETRIPDSLVGEQLGEVGAVVDGFLIRGPVAIPHITHPGILGFARDTGGEVIEGPNPTSRIAEMIQRIKFRYSIHFVPAESTSPRPRRIRIGLSDAARSRYPNAILRSRRIYFPKASYKPKPIVPSGQTVAANR